MLSVSDLQNLISPKINETVLLEVLQKQSQCKNVVLKYILDKNPNSRKGDSYLSTIHRFCIVYCKNESDDEQSLHVVAKSPPKNIGRRKTMRSTDFFLNEAIFFNTVWPALDSFQRSRTSTGVFKNIPNCFVAYCDGINDYILLEDLNILGYANAERAISLDFEHATVIFKAFAEFHALSFAFKSEKPEEFKSISDSLKETYFTEELRGWYINFFKKVMEIVKDAVSKELPKSYLEKIEKLYNSDYLGFLIKLFNERGPLSVITHGDGWMPNFLFSWNENSVPQDVYIIDFQLTRCASIVMDLLFLLYSCTDHSLREKHFDDLLKVYLTSFNEFLQGLGCSQDLNLTMDALKGEFSRYGSFGVGMPMEGIIMSTLEDNDVSDLDSIEGEEEVPITSVWIIKPLKTKEKRLRLANCVKHCIDQGFLDSIPDL